MTFFPRLPVLQDGQVLGATTLNLYTRALQFLLGFSHSSFAAHRSRDNKRYQDTWGVIWDAWAYMSYKRVYMLAEIGLDAPAGGRIGYLSLQYFGDDGNWHSIWDDTTTVFYENNFISIALDLSAALHLSLNKWYMFRMVARTGAPAYHVHFRPWVVGIAPLVEGWMALPAFPEGVVSAAADFNTIRNNAYALNNFIPKYTSFSRSKELTNPNTWTWNRVTELAIQQRNNPDILLGMQLRSQGAHQWRARCWDTAGVEHPLYTSPIYALGTAPQWTLRTAQVVLPGAPGDFFRIQFDNKVHSNDWNVHGQRCYALYESDLTVGADWPVLTDWVHGDGDVGPLRLDTLTAALTSLYSGDEQLFSITPFVGGLTWVSGDSVQFVGVHNRRWLIYYNDGSEDRPVVHYGPNFEFSHDLPREPLDTMVSYDMAEIKRLRPGMLISIEGVQFAAESGRVLT